MMFQNFHPLGSEVIATCNVGCFVGEVMTTLAITTWTAVIWAMLSSVTRERVTTARVRSMLSTCVSMLSRYGVTVHVCVVRGVTHIVFSRTTDIRLRLPLHYFWLSSCRHYWPGRIFSARHLHIYALCGIIYRPWHRHQIEGTHGFSFLLCWSHTVANIWRMGLWMQFATNSQWSQIDRQTFVGGRKHSRSFMWCCKY